MRTKVLENFLKVKTRNDFENNTHISLKNRYVFIQVSKAASSSVKWALQSLEFLNTPWKVMDVNNKFYAPHISPYQVSEESLEEIFNSDSFKKVAFVRNPYTRLLSCYLHRIIGNPRSASNKALMFATGGKGGPDISFNEFVEVVCSQPSIEQESHWRCQHDDIGANNYNYDFVGKVENLDDDINELASSLYGEVGTNWIRKNSKKNASPMTTKSSEKLSIYYSDEHIKGLVKKRFEKDFLNFGYSYEIF